MSNLPDNNDVVMLELDRPRELRLGHRALKRFSALTECSLSAMDKEIERYDKASCLIWVMVTEDQRKNSESKIMTPDELDDLLDNIPISKILEVCSKAIEAAFPELEVSKSDTGEESPMTAAGTGTEA